MNPTVEITGLNSEGAGVGRLPDGRVVFVPRTAPGDRVRVRITGGKKRWARGDVEALESPGPGRREAPCPFYARCGGCALQHLAPEAQRASKGAWVMETLRRVGGLEDLPEPAWGEAGPEFGYRNRLTFHLRRLATGRVVAGFHDRERPGRLVEVDGRCLLAEPALAQGWDRLRGAWGPGADFLPRGDTLRLTLRATQEGELLLLVEGGRGVGDPEALVEGAGLLGVWARSEGEIRPRFLAGKAGPDGVPERWLGERIQVRPGAFLQVNRTGADALARAALVALGAQEGDQVLDAYCGVGSYGRELAARGVQVTGIELDPEALQVAGGAGGAGTVEGLTLLEGRVEDRLGEALPAHRVILNPPRGGVAPGVMEALAEGGGGDPPRRIVYVSCAPPTLARDLAALGDGYRVTAVTLFDLFPQTAHVETLVRLDRID